MSVWASLILIGLLLGMMAAPYLFAYYLIRREEDAETKTTGDEPW